MAMLQVLAAAAKSFFPVTNTETTSSPPQIKASEGRRDEYAAICCCLPRHPNIAHSSSLPRNEALNLRGKQKVTLQVLAAAAKFAAAFQETQMPLLRSMQTLHAHHNAGVRRCAVAWALALLPYVARSQVSFVLICSCSFLPVFCMLDEL